MEIEASLYARNVINYHTLIDGFCKKTKGLQKQRRSLTRWSSIHGVSRNSWPLLKRENERGYSIDGPDDNGRVQLPACALLQGQCKASRDQIKDMVLNPVIQARFGQKRSKEAVKLFREMIEKAEALCVVTYKIVF
ncbi:hypothetical protein NC652_006901 [Populus alba x Populus x berolinensis]|nr:hypothetical protein NC652_006901 [Populus alba x Populus x berolinensis]